MFSPHQQVLPSNPPLQGILEPQVPMSMVPMIGPRGELVYCMTQANQMMPSLAMSQTQQPLQLKLMPGEFPGVNTPGYYQGHQNEQVLVGQMHGNRLLPPQPMQALDLMQNQSNKMCRFSASEPSNFQLQSTEYSAQESLFSKTTGQMTDNTVASRTIISRTTSIEKEKYSLSNEDTGTLGPVEKAVFQEAIHILNKTRNGTVPQNCEVCNTTLQTQVQSDNHYKSKKHCRAMLEQRAAQEKTAARQSLYGSHVTTAPAQNNAFSIEQAQIVNPISANNREIGGLEIGPNYIGSAVAPARFHPYTKPQFQADNSGLERDVIAASNRSLGPSKNENVNGDSSTNTFDSQPSAANDNLVSTVYLSAVHTVQVPKAPGIAPLIQSKPSSPDVADAIDNGDQNKSITEKETTTTSDELSMPDQTGSEQNSPLPNNDCDESMSDASGHSSAKTDASESSKHNESPPREVYLPDPLPSYITKMDRPPGRVLKESLHCTTCDIYVNSENQMKQHVSSLRHKNTLQGIPTPPKPVKEEKPKVKAEQYRCNICKVTLNSDIQLSQHLSSLRHKNMLEGKPPKPRWSPYERAQQSLLRSPAALGPPFIYQATQANPSTISGALTDLQALTHPGLSGHYLTPSASAQIKQASFMMSDAGLLQAREIVYLGGPPVSALQQGASIPGAIPTFPGFVPNQQQLLPSVLAAPTNGLDWSSGLRLAS